MNPLRQFDEFLEIGIIKKRTPDLMRAESLIIEAQKRKSFLNEMMEKISVSNENEIIS